MISGRCLLVVAPFLTIQASLGIWREGSKLHSLVKPGGMVVGDNSSSTIAYGGFFRFQSFSLQI